MGVTPKYQFPYPELTDPPDGPAQIKALALAVETKLSTMDAIAKAKELFTTLVTVTFPNSAFSSAAAVTFPVGRFTAIPIMAGSSTESWYTLRANTVTTASATISARWDTGTPLTQSAVMGCIFVNSPSTAPTQTADTPPIDDEGVPATLNIATCHQPGCSNAEHGIEVWLWPGTTVQCGACGNPITDVVPAA